MKFVRELRKHLASELSNKVNDESNKTHYETISEGDLPELSKIFSILKLENMEKELDSSKAIGQIYNEFISEIISRDIYILNYQKKDVNAVGTTINRIYKNRESSVILYRPGHHRPGDYKLGHYELVGLIENENTLRLSFKPNHPFIVAIKNRMSELVKI